MHPFARTVAEHQDAVLRLVGVPRHERVALDWTAVGRVLAEPLVARESLPRFRSSAMDGYAVRPADDGQRAFPVVADIPAGDGAEVRLLLGEAARVMTGARVPAGTAFVIPVEETDARAVGPAPCRIAVAGLPAVGRHVREAGEEVAAGAPLAGSGSVLGPAVLALGRSTGCTAALVRARLRVAVVATGAELTAPGASPGHGGVFESNSDMLAALVTQAGASVSGVHTCPDDPGLLAALLDEFDADASVDLVLTTGGLSQGAYEVVRQACEERTEFEFVRVGMQPGAPQGLGVWGSTPVICLPGTPSGSLTSFHVFVRSALGGRPTSRRLAYAGSAKKVRPGVTQFLAGVLTSTGGVVLAPGGHFAAHANADVLIEVDASAAQLAPGDPVVVWPLG